jgi:dihydroorotate dehydrogenase electron transfer subunit
LPDNQNKRTLLVGGGVGIAPLLLLGKVLKNNGFLPEFLLGGRSATDVLQMDEFEKFGKINITTEDGSLGEKGFVTHHSVLANQQFDKIYACGPKPMMVAISNYAHRHDIECEVSLENMRHADLEHACVVSKNHSMEMFVYCTDGPVFNIKETDMDRT